MNQIYLLLLFVFLSSSIASQSLTQFTHYSVEDGLSENNVLCMLQDYKGNMWFGTYNGLNKFDGYFFKTYKGNPDDKTVLLNYRIDNVKEDLDGYLWIQTYNGRTYRFDPGTERFLAIPQCLPEYKNYQLALKAIYPLGDSSVWIAGGNFGEDDCFRVKNEKHSNQVKVTNFNVANGQLTSNKINKIYLDRQRCTWILTSKGVSYLRKDAIFTSQLFKDKPSGAFHSICETSSFLYLGGEHGQFARYDYRKRSVENISIHGQSTIIDIHQVNDHLLFILTDHQGFCLFDQGTKKFTWFNKSNGCGLRSDCFYGCYMDKWHNVWLDTDLPLMIYFETDKQKINCYDVSYNCTVSYTKDLNFFVFEDQYDHTWVHSKNGGFSCYNRITNQLEPFYNDPKSPDRMFSHIVRTAISDRQGNLWLCPYSYGIEKVVFRDSPFRFFKPVPGRKFLEQNQVRSLFQDKNNRLWVGTKEGSLYLFDGNQNLIGRMGADGIINSSTPLDVPIYHIMSDHNGVIWLASKGKGLFRVQEIENSKGLSFRLTNYQHCAGDKNSLSSNSVYYLFEDHLNRIWVATYGGGLNLMDTLKGQIRFVHSLNGLKNYPRQGMRVRYLAEDRKGYMYAGTTEGLLMYSIDATPYEKIKFFHYSHNPEDENSISGNDVHSILPCRNGKLYVGIYGGGLNVANKGIEPEVIPKFRVVGKDNAAPLDVVFTIQEDAKGEIWVSTQNKLAKFNSKTERFDIYKPIMSSTYSFMEASVCRMNREEFCYGTTEGFVLFDPLKVKKSSYVPRIVFTQLQLLNRTVEVGVHDSPLSKNIDDTQKLCLSHKDNMISISFSALDYRDHQGIQYAYQLEGFDAEWNYVGGQHVAIYTNLPKGIYTFRVKSTNSDGQWVNNERSIVIERMPSFWESSWGLLFYLSVFIGITGMVSYILFTIYRLKNDVMVEHRITNMKLQFFTDISHELRTPLTLIASPVEHMLRYELLTERVKGHLIMIQRNTDRMLRLINQILDFRKIESSKMKLVVEDVEIAPFVSDICLNFNDLAHDKNIDFRIIDHSNRVHLWIDKDKVEKILFNLLSNSFKFTSPGDTIKVCIDEELEFVCIAVEDTGIGISREKQERLFKRFESFNTVFGSMQTGTGIGLSLTKELVELHRAKITVESEQGQGSSFKVSFKKGHDHFSNEPEYVLHDLNQETSLKREDKLLEDCSEKFVKESNFPSSDGVSILVVEDNEELRHFISSVLCSHYHVMEAVNGKEALALLPSCSPSIIISDVLMPEISGFELLKVIKNDLNYSHIPVVLLTAKNDIDSKVLGLEYGVDDYITKPFSSVYLVARIENLLKLRRQLQEYYCSSLVGGALPSIKPNITTRDDAFIHRIIKYIEENIEDSELSIDGLALFIGLSRSSMFKKIKSLTSLAPVDFIKEIRIKRAAQLIETGEFNVSQVAYMVGMTDPRYFSKCFKQRFGISPREYKEKHLCEGRS